MFCLPWGPNFHQDGSSDLQSVVLKVHTFNAKDVSPPEDNHHMNQFSRSSSDNKTHFAKSMALTTSDIFADSSLTMDMRQKNTSLVVVFHTITQCIFHQHLSPGVMKTTYVNV